MSKQMLSIEQMQLLREQGFDEGANWRINSVWHGDDEVPERSAQCLVEFIDPDFDNEFSRYKLFSFCTPSVGFLGFKKEYKLIRWAYVKDLIPTKEE